MPYMMTGAGAVVAITATGRPTIVGRGPYRVCDVALVFEHGPMRARVSFQRPVHHHAGVVSQFT
jgi:hypothetical protein